MKKFIVGALITGLMTPMIAGCGTSSASGPTVVTIWSWRAQDANMWKNVQATLNKKGDNLQIQFRAVTPTEYDSVVQTAMDGGQGPDIFYDRAGIGTLDYAAAHMIAPLNGIVNFSKVSPATLATDTYKGKDYGVPFAIQTMGIFYNKAIFAKYGLTVPTTWSQFIHECDVLKSHGVTPISTMGIQSWMLALNFDEIGATMMGDHFTQELVAKKATYDSAPYINALAHYQQLSQFFEPNFQAVGSADNEQEVAVALGKAAMCFDGIFDVPTMKQYNPKLQLGQFLVPPANATQHRRIDWYLDGDFSLNSHIANAAVKKASEEILAYTATTAFGQDFSDINGGISPIAGVTIPSKFALSTEAYHWFETRPINPIFGIRSPMDTPPPSAATVETKNAKPALNTDQGIFTAEQDVMLPLLLHKLTPAEAAAKVQKTVAWYFKK